MRTVLEKVKHWRFKPRESLSPKPVKLEEIDNEMRTVQHGSLLHNEVFITNPATVISNDPLQDITIDGHKRAGRMIVDEDKNIQVRVKKVMPTIGRTAKISKELRKVIVHSLLHQFHCDGSAWCICCACNSRFTECRRSVKAPLYKTLSRCLAG